MCDVVGFVCRKMAAPVRYSTEAPSLRCRENPAAWERETGKTDTDAHVYVGYLAAECSMLR